MTLLPLPALAQPNLDIPGNLVGCSDQIPSLFSDSTREFLALEADRVGDGSVRIGAIYRQDQRNQRQNWNCLMRETDTTITPAPVNPSQDNDTIREFVEAAEAAVEEFLEAGGNEEQMRGFTVYRRTVNNEAQFWVRARVQLNSAANTAIFACHGVEHGAASGNNHNHAHMHCHMIQSVVGNVLGPDEPRAE